MVNSTSFRAAANRARHRPDVVEQFAIIELLIANRCKDTALRAVAASPMR